MFAQPPSPSNARAHKKGRMYPSAGHWKRPGVLKNIDIEFCDAGAVLFGERTTCPRSWNIDAHKIRLRFCHRLESVTGSAREATFSRTHVDGSKHVVTKPFLHAARNAFSEGTRFHSSEPSTCDEGCSFDIRARPSTSVRRGHARKAAPFCGRAGHCVERMFRLYETDRSVYCDLSELKSVIFARLEHIAAKCQS